jgi:PKD repeat protein
VHRYAADGTYTVSLAVRTPDGREASTSRTLQVATHDAAIIKLTTARSASAGQTKPITADITSRRYAETVTVQLFKGTPQGFTFVAEKRVAVKEGKTVRVTFNYRFTAADASIGRVTFKVVTLLDGYRDALPADNEALTSPTKVAK